MAYYAFAHILQNNDMYGRSGGAIEVEKLTDEVFDYVLLGEGGVPDGVDGGVVERMKREFEFWYPFDLRVSGKDLIQNHLTFCLYSHTAVWEGKEGMWPVGIRCNGHLMVN